MTEIPEHLLQRTRARRQALGLPVSGGDADGAAAPAASGGGGTAVSRTEASLPKGPQAPATGLEQKVAAPALVPHYVQAFHRRAKIPIWALPVVAALPFWGFIYAGTLEPPPVTELTMVGEGEEVYANCSACHGAAGAGGGAFPALNGGAVLETFPNPVDQVRWIILGSEKGTVDGTYGNGKQSAGGMPAFGGTLSAEEIAAVVRYVREAFSGENFEDVAEDWVGLTALAEDEEVAEKGITEEELREVLEHIAEDTDGLLELPEG